MKMAGRALNVFSLLRDWGPNRASFRVMVEAILQKQIAYRYKERPYYKHVIVLPEETVKALGWKEGQQLKGKISGGGKLILMPIKAKGAYSAE